jgi:hypothetical protein
VEAVIQAEEVMSLFIGHTFCIVGICRGINDLNYW